MFTSKTVFVLGAGASREVNMPLGEGLLYEIKTHLSRLGSGSQIREEDSILFQAIQQSGVHPNRITDLVRSIARGLTNVLSIDNLIHNRSHDADVVTIGKICIPHILVQKERGCALFIKSNNKDFHNSSMVSDSWLRDFYHLLTERVSYANLDSIFDNVSFISFNYDRCIKQFLYYALPDTFGISGDRAAQLIKKLKIVHPYGSLGNLPWEKIQSGVTTAFGEKYPKLVELRDEIITFNETMGGKDGIKHDISELLKESDKVVFLGFAYYEQNLDLLKTNFPTGTSRAVFGSACEISDTLQGNIATNLSVTIGQGGPIRLSNKTCKLLFKEFGSMLAQ